MRTLGVLLFPDFELLDVCGPLEILGNRNLATPLFEIVTVAESPGLVASVQGAQMLAQHGLDGAPLLDALLVPGGAGTRRQVDSARTLDWLRQRAGDAELVLSVCTGAALLARAGLLDGRRATSNKRHLDWVMTQGPRVQWLRRARWVDEGKFVTSSGVSAGMDMALAVVARLAGRPQADHIARVIEYSWHDDPGDDPFCG